MFTTTTVLALVIATTLARADDFQGLGFLPGGTSSAALGVNANGSVVVGNGTSASAGPIGEAFRWTAPLGMTGLGFLPGGTYSVAAGVNANGSVVAGYSQSTNAGGYIEAFRWTGGVMTGLGFLPGGIFSFAQAVNANGSVVVGHSNSTNAGASVEAFRWVFTGSGPTGGIMTGLGFLPGGTYSGAQGVNSDGSVVIGYADSTSADHEAFRWVFTGSGPTLSTMTGLGFLPGGGFSIAQAVNADGSVVVGLSTSANAGGNNEAFRWVFTGSGPTLGTMTGLGFLAGGNTSSATAVNAKGSVVVGQSNSTSVPGGEAFRWTTKTGMQSIKDLLVASGVNMTGWTLTNAQGVSANGTGIVGYGTDPSSQTEAWFARFSTQFGNGMITPGAVAQSFSGLAAMGQTGNAAIGNSLGTFTEVATQAGSSQGSGNTPFSAFGYGGYDSDPAASGTLGMTVKLADAMVAGAALSANYVRTNMVYDGSSKMSGGSAGVFLARVPDAGLQWLVGVGGITLKGDIDRGYLNGSGLALSSGSTTANGYGLTGRIGWTLDHVWRATQVTPFASYTYSTIHFNGYTETTGVFPAQFNGFTNNAQTTRVGADARYTLAPGQWLWGTLAWAHRLDGGRGADITGTLIGLFGMTATGASVAQDWVEITGGIRLPVWKNGAVTASITASVPAAFPTTYAARVGVTQAF